MSTNALYVFLLFTIIISTTQASIGGYICPGNRKKFLTLLTKSLSTSGNDPSVPYFWVKGHKLLNEQLDSNLVKQSCANLKALYKPDDGAENSFYILSAWAQLKCSGSLHTPQTVKNIQELLVSEKSTLLDIHYAVEIFTLLGQSIPDSAKLAQNIQKKLKEDDTLPSLGHVLHTAALLGNAGKFAHNKIDEVLSQADEVDGKLLQWEGGLSVTSLLLTGILRLSNPLTQIQGDKIGNYLLSRTTVQTPKGIVALLEAANALTASSVSPVSITIKGKPYVTIDSPDLTVQVSNILGEAIKTGATPVVAQSVTRTNDKVIVLAKQPLKAGSGPVEFILPLRVESGNYNIELLAGSNTASLNVKVLGPVSLQWLEIGLGDTDGNSAPKLIALEPPRKLSSNLQADSTQHLIAKFLTTRIVHQAFLRLYSGSKEIIFVAEPDNSKVYKIDVNLASELSSSGTYEIELILGDSLLTHPLRWVLGSVEVQTSSSEEPKKITKGPKPEIKHLFRPAEKRPSEVVSLLFTALTAAPLLLLIILWLNIGINFGNFTAVALPFHLGFGSILGLFTLFWLKLDMFTTCAWLIPIGAFTFLSGHKLLSHLARSKDKKAEK